jgi:16S rRNA (adenine1518-N6/adenine1519-N6)-dimethyltransferase
MIRPKKRLGQHFLTDPLYCQKIVQFADITLADTVIEIGPGTGNLTSFLIKHARRVIAIEIDPSLVSFLEEEQQSALEEHQLQLIEADVLELDWPHLLDQGIQPTLPQEPPVSCQNVKVVGNLPYNLATRILTMMTGLQDRFHSLTIMTQKEVALRVLAAPGSPDYGYLTVFLSLFFEGQRGFDVPPGAFFPNPKVVSQVLKLMPVATKRAAVPVSEFQTLVQIAFKHPRKTLRNNLRTIVGTSELDRVFQSCDLPLQIRPGQVSLERYLCMTRRLSRVLSFAI